MPTILDPARREALLQRLRRLQPTAPARWGTLTAPRMLSHLADSLRVAVGELPAKRVDSLPSRTLAKWIVVYSPVRPPPGKIRTSPEMLTSEPASWAEDLARVEALIGRIASGEGGRHPFFGPLTPGGWGRLTWKHVDHHLRQFGG